MEKPASLLFPDHPTTLMNLPPAPTVLISGFLGAGKTTFLHRLLPPLAERGLAPYVLINDYRNAEVDASGLRAIGRAGFQPAGTTSSVPSAISTTFEPARRHSRANRHPPARVVGPAPGNCF